MILWFCGNVGSGKSTAASRLAELDTFVWLDGNRMREVWPGLGFSAEDRREQHMRIARLARELLDQSFDVVVSSICPYRALRDQIRLLIPEVQFVFLAGGKEPSEEYPYEGRQPDERIS